MENENDMILADSTGDDVILPDGWTEETDIFAWTGDDAQADEPLESLLGDDEVEDGSEEGTDIPATDEEYTEDDESETEEGEQPATPDEPDDQSTILRFDANINHHKKSIEIDQSELPELYEKAYAADKFRNKLNAKVAEQEKAEIVSKLLGYKSVDEMLDQAKTSYMQAEIDRLVSEKVHPTIAQDTVNRRVKELEDQAIKDRKPVIPEDEPEDAQPNRPERDFKPEVAELLTVYPELKGKTLPDEVVQATVTGGMSLTAAYTQYVQKQTKAENERLQRENKTLKQNAEAARRAPVRGVAKSGATNLEAEDPFLKGFNL